MRASQFAVPIAQLPVFVPDLAAGEAAAKMAERGAGWALVVAGGHIVGVLELRDLPAAGQRAKAAAAAGAAAPAVNSSSWSLTRG